MARIWRLQTTVWADSIFPRDGVTMTPHFKDNGALSNPDNLCEDLATAINTWMIGPGSRQIVVKAYDATGTPPVFPEGEALRNANQVQNSAFPRELAICLSYFSERNQPRKRGRLYVPHFLANGSAPALRPTLAQRQKIADLVPIFASLGGADVDWVVWSRADGEARKVSHWWVDDEWDIVRSRGLRPSTRLEGTTSG